MRLLSITGIDTLGGLWEENGTTNGKPRFIDRSSKTGSIEWGTDGLWRIKPPGGLVNYPGPNTGDVPPECNGKDKCWGRYGQLVLSYVPDSMNDSNKYPMQLSRDLYKKRKFADVTVCCGPQSIEVNSCVLAVSPVFEKMLEAPMLEGKRRVINIDDFPADSVEHFIEVLYTGNCTECDWGAMLLMSDKYQLPHVVQVCLGRMKASLSAQTVVPYLSAMNKTSHLEECAAARTVMIERVKGDAELVKTMAHAL
eukprot:TRINITY_DN105882_c0_g1_i1.p1 TRINITY_DN105882_c0_g1~~TRINITY_DN105882_c0_g1_i1.p1  ORF type:complete len:253 (+),score=27.11 TRINITY_DN105882_c0_g1_i1:140-898(+)